MTVPCDTSLEEATRRFFEGAKGGLAALSRDRLTALEEKVPRFFEGVRQGLAVLGPAVAELDCHLARRFSTFAYIHLDENLMSDVLADLLGRDLAHGQGDLFLTALLKDLRKEAATPSGTNLKTGMERLGLLPGGSTWSGVRVVREALTTHIEAWHRRIDVEISMRVGEEIVAIAIENKPSAEDQPGQLDDYARHLDKKYRGQYLLLYLTPNQTSPDRGSIEPIRQRELENQGRFACVSLVKWTQGWMLEAENQVRASYVQRFVADFRQAVLRKYTHSGAEPGSVTLLGQVAS